VIPPLMGLAADSIGLSRAFFVPLAAYVGIVAFAAAAALGGRASVAAAPAPAGH
jgi:hypothetical protein